jgi:exopolysaccharide production protein ExoZ
MSALHGALANEPRTTRPKPTFRLIQGLRGLAALLVVAHHASILAVERLSAPWGVWRNGAAGVDLFFVISGFVMALTAPSLRAFARPGTEFFKRRIERIVPLYWIATTAKILLILLLPAAALHPVGGVWHLVASYLFLPSRDASGTVFPILVVGWTLNLEMMFYAIFAVALAFRIGPLRFLAPVLLTLAALGYFLHPTQTALASFTNPIVPEFLLGILLFRLYERGLRFPPWAMASLMISGFAVLLLVDGSQSRLRALIWGFPALAIVAAAIALEARMGHRLPAFARELGDASYSIYLTHTFALPLVGIALARIQVAPRWSTSAAILAGLIVSAAAGELVYRGLELPMIRFFRNGRKAAVASRT